MKQVCDVCGAERWWGIAPPPPCPVTIRAQDGSTSKCPGTLRNAIDEQAVDVAVEKNEQAVENLSAENPQAVNKLFDEPHRYEVIEVVDKVDRGERSIIARRVEARDEEVVSVDSLLVAAATHDVEIYQSGYTAGQRAVIDHVLSTAENYVRIASACGAKQGADLLADFVSKLRGDFAQ